MEQVHTLAAPGASVCAAGACAAGVSTATGASAVKASLPAPQTGQRSGQSALSHFQPQMEQVQTLAATGASVCAAGACAAGVSIIAGASAVKASLPAPQTGQRSGQSALSHFQPQMEQVQTLAAAGASVCAAGACAACSSARSAAAPAPQTGQVTGLSAPAAVDPHTRHTQFFSISHFLLVYILAYVRPSVIRPRSGQAPQRRA